MSKIHILVVDDYPENIQALSALIDAKDVEVHSALNAEAALHLLTQHDFGLALIDVQMPGMNGFELARLIRGLKRFRHLPIFFVTAQKEDQATLFEGYETGAVDLLFKPLDPHIVRTKVRVFVELSQQRQLLKEQMEEMERLRIDAEAANIAKSQFLANMSHEIRTPLGAVMGFAEILSKSELTEKERTEFSQSIRKNGNHLLRLIDDILDISRIEANRLELEMVEFDLQEMLDDLASTFSLKAEEKRIGLQFLKAKMSVRRFVSDPVRIRQALLNVIGNALKFTKKGKITVDANVTEEEGHWLKVVITDEGIGLTEEQAGRLFQPFGQADASTRRKFGGSGLGLVISREIIRALGGDLVLLHSAPGKGSAFQITVPLVAATAKAEQRPEKADKGEGEIDLRDKKILAVDDSADNLAILDMFLRPNHATLTLAESGLAALEAVRAHDFDLVLMDIQMPGMDGHEATEKLRASGFSAPILAITAHAVKSEHERCLASGCNDVLTKPIDRDKLLQKISHFLP